VTGPSRNGGGIARRQASIGGLAGVQARSAAPPHDPHAFSWKKNTTVFTAGSMSATPVEIATDPVSR